MNLRFVSILLLALSPTVGHAFDVINERMSYSDNKFLTLRADLGTVGLAKDRGVEGEAGFGVRLSAGHSFTSYLEAEILYQLSTFRMTSPDPLDPSLLLSTRSGMNQELIRFIVCYPSVLLQPYLSAGFGGYNLFGVNSETALSFPVHMQVPLAIGVRAYTYRNLVSFHLEFGYQFLYGENQSADTLRLLGLQSVSFNAYSVMFGAVFHMM